MTFQFLAVSQRLSSKKQRKSRVLSRKRFETITKQPGKVQTCASAKVCFGQNMPQKHVKTTLCENALRDLICRDDISRSKGPLGLSFFQVVVPMSTLKGRNENGSSNQEHEI